MKLPLLVGLLCCGLAHADEPALTVTVGAERSTQTRSGGNSARAEWSPLIGLDYRDGRFFASTEQGVGYELFKSEALTVFAAAGFAPGRKEGRAQDNRRLVGMGRIQASGLLLAGVGYAPLGEWLQLHATLLQSTTRAQGGTVNLGATVGFPVWGPVSGFVEAGTTRADRRHAQTFYGVTPVQAARSGNPVYTAKAGWVSRELNLGLDWEIDSRWSASATVGRQQRVGVARASPLFERRNEPTASLSASYRF